MRKISLFFITLLLAVMMASPVSATQISVSVTPTPAPVDYQLPYPGLLPGHPFYFLKSFRDKIWGFMISNSLKKAEFYLLQSDKSLQAASYLFQQNKPGESIDGALKRSEEYFLSAITEAKEAKKQGAYTIDVAAKITIANLKHQEVITNLLKTAKGDDKKRFEVELIKLKELGSKASELNSK